MTTCIFSLWLFNFYIGYIIRYAGLHNSQDGIKIAGRNVNIHRYEDDTALIAESKKELKSLLMRRGDAKTGLKHNIKKLFTKIYSTFMASCHTPSWLMDEGEVKTVADLIFLGPETTMDLDCSHKIKRHLLLVRKKGYEKPAQCIKKKRLTFSSNQVEMCNLDNKKGGMAKN